MFLCLAAHDLRAEDTGKLINNKCRANLKMLNEATAKFLAENDSGLPSWANHQTVTMSLVDRKYFAEELVPPTRDCKYISYRSVARTISGIVICTAFSTVRRP